MTIIALYESEDGTIPSAYRNMALTAKEMYGVQVGHVSNPSSTYLQSIGNPILPSIMVMYADGTAKITPGSGGPGPADKAGDEDLDGNTGSNPNDGVKFQVII